MLPDGWYVYIGGEHDDSYDPDFVIYNGTKIAPDLNVLKDLG
jgi:hypothetical protein